MTKVLVAGSFNILHPGHLRLLRYAKECADHLVVGVYSDKIAGQSAHMSQDFRLEGLYNNSLVNEVVLVDEPITEFIHRLRPDIVVKGKEHEHKFNPELDVLNKYGGRLLFSSGESTFSSIDLLRKEFAESTPQTINLPSSYMARNQVSATRLSRLVQTFKGLRVCVVGDLIVDEYITCEPLGMSQEDPTVVVSPIDSTYFLGGAGIVAAHGAGLGADVRFISVCGEDSIRDIAIKKLDHSKVQANLITVPSRPTILKQRFRSKGKTLLRVSRLHQDSIDSRLQKLFLEHLENALDAADLLVFSDFNYGCLSQNVVNKACEMARSRNTIMVADSQSSSQIGDVSRFYGMHLLTPTEREARLATRNYEDGLIVLAEHLREKAKADNILLTLGEEGLIIHAGRDGSFSTDRLQAINSAPKDTTGAGDSLLITSAMSLAGGGNIWEAALIGTLAAAVQVGRVGNTPITSEELTRDLP